MKYERIPVYLVTLLSTLFFAKLDQIIANDAPVVVSVGKSISPRKDVPVRMVSESVSITIDNTIARVYCTFDFHNEGPSDTLEVGFPRGWEKDLYDFLAKVDGKFVPVRTGAHKPIHPFNLDKIVDWKIFEVPFLTKGSKVKVRNWYWTVLSNTKYDGLFDQRFVYILKTGALWAGTIGDATITITLRNTHPDQITKLEPSGYVQEGQRITWQFRDFEPKEDIEIHLMQDFLYGRLLRSQMLLKQDPNNAEGHFLSGTVYFNQEGVFSSKAQDSFSKALSLNPKLWDARWYLVAIYYLKENWDALQYELETIIEGNPEYICRDEAFSNYMYADLPTHIPQGFLESVRHHLSEIEK